MVSSSVTMTSTVLSAPAMDGFPPISLTNSLYACSASTL